MISILIFLLFNLIFSKELLSLDISQSPINLLLFSESLNYTYNVIAKGNSKYINFDFIESPSHIIKYKARNNLNENITGFIQNSGNIIIPYSFYSEKPFEILLDCYENCLSNITIYFEDTITLEPMSSNTFKISGLYNNEILFNYNFDNESFIYLKSLEKKEINLSIDNSQGIFNDYFDIIYYNNQYSDKIGQHYIEIEIETGDYIKLVSTTIGETTSIDQSKSYLDRYYFRNSTEGPLILKKPGMTLDVRTRCDSNAITWENYYGISFNLNKELAAAQSYFLYYQGQMLFRIRSSTNETVMCNLQTALFDDFDISNITLNNALKPNISYIENIENRKSSAKYLFKAFTFERSKYKYNKYIINVTDYKYNVKYANSNISKVYLHKCDNYPFCYYDKDVIDKLEESGEVTSFTKTNNSFIFSFLQNETDINLVMIVYCERWSMFIIKIDEEYIPEPKKPDDPNDSTNPSEQDTSNNLGLIISMIIISLVIIVLLVLFFVRRHKLKKEKNSEEEVIELI